MEELLELLEFEPLEFEEDDDDWLDLFLSPLLLLLLFRPDLLFDPEFPELFEPEPEPEPEPPDLPWELELEVEVSLEALHSSARS